MSTLIGHHYEEYFRYMPNNDQFGEYIVIRNGKYLTLKYLKIFELKIYRGVMCPENEE